MRIKKIVAIEEVKDDLDAGVEFYDLQELGVGSYFRDCMIADIESLWLYAGIHVKHFGFYRLLSARFPYTIYYDIQGDVAIVVAVLDTRKNPTWIHQKLKGRKC